jgi:hypothetical protein
VYIMFLNAFSLYTHTHTHTHTHTLTHTQPRFEDLEECQVCREDHTYDQMLVCDRCELCFHTFCLTPPITEIPEGSWFCERYLERVV